MNYDRLIADLEREKSEIIAELERLKSRTNQLNKRMMEIRLAIYEMERIK